MALPTLSVVPSFAFVQDTSYDMLRSNPKEGASFRRAKHDDKLRVFIVTFKTLGKTDKDTIETLYTNVKGAGGRFTWTPPNEGSSITVRFLDDRLVWNKKSHVNYGIKIRIEEVLQPTQP